MRRRPRGTACTVRRMTPRTTASSTTGVLGAGAAAAIDHRPGISPSRPAPVQNSRDTPRYHNVLCLPRAPQLLQLCQRDLVGGSNTRLPYSGSVAPCARIPGRGTSGKSRGAPKAAWPRCPHRLGNLRVAWAAVRPHLESYLQWVAMPTKHVKGKVGQAPVAGLAQSSPSSPPSRSFVATTDRHVRRQPLPTLECPLASRIPGACPSGGGVLHSGQASSMYVKSHTQELAFGNSILTPHVRQNGDKHVNGASYS